LGGEVGEGGRREEVPVDGGDGVDGAVLFGQRRGRLEE